MLFHYNTTPDETVSFLRDQAIRAKQPPAVIDALDALRDLLDVPSDLEKAEQLFSEVERDRDDLREELQSAVDQLQIACDILTAIDEARAGKGPATYYDDADLKSISRQLDFAKKALERHKA